jgi:hypothetical protein
MTGLGLLLVLWALGTLGRSFGIAPATAAWSKMARTASSATRCTWAS